jgi:hypothetical protein
MINKKLARAVAATAGVGLAFAGLVGVAAPAQAAENPTTSFKIHLNVPAAVAAQWNIWSWGDCNGANDNTIGASSRNLGTDAAPNVVTQDWTPNFSNDDAYGSYAEFTVPCTVTALNNVMRTTESWDGQEAAAEVPAVPEVPEVPAVEDDPATVGVDETAAAIPAVPAVPAIPAKVAIPGSDKPFGGDNIFPAGESWWNVNTGKREYPLKDIVSIKVHVNAKLATLQSQGWNYYSWNTSVTPPKLSTTIKAYKGKVDANLTGWGFSGSDAYGSYAIIKTARIYAGNVGLVLRRSGKIGTGTAPSSGWGGPQSGDFKNTDGNTNGFKLGALEYWQSLGSADMLTAKPTFVGRYGATATYAAGKLTVTPVRPAHVSLQGMYADKIVVTAKKGATTKTCTIASTALATESPSWGLASSCDMDVAQGAEVQPWEVFVRGSATGVGTALLGPAPAKKINVPVL